MTQNQINSKKKDKSIQIQEAIDDPNVPKLYANGFLNAVGQGDTLILFLQNGKPVAVLNLSYTLSKTLALKLGHLIKKTEDEVKTTILTTEDFVAGFEKAIKKEDKDSGGIGVRPRNKSH